MNIEEILAAMKELTDVAEKENRSLSDEEVTRYESLEKDLQAARKTLEIRARQKAYETPNVIANPITAGAKGDEVLERAFDHYLRTGVPNADLTELRAQSTSDAAGGYTIPNGFRNKLVEVQNSFGGIRSVAEVIHTSDGRPLPWASLDDTANSGDITAESEAVADGADLTFGTGTLGAYKYTSAGAGTNLPLRVSVELLQDSAFDVAGLVSRKLGERIARKQAAHFATGTGVSQPKGLFTTTSDLNNGGTTITYSKLLDAYHTVDPYYRNDAVWVMNDSSLKEIENLVDTAGRPLVQPNANSGIAGRPSNGQLLGHAVIVDNGTVVASGNNFIAFGNIREGYVIRDVRDVTVVVNPYSRAAYGEVEYHAWARADATIQNRDAYATVKDTRP